MKRALLIGIDEYENYRRLSGFCDILTKYRNAKLIEFVSTEYLYHAAMESKSCRLTPHGRHYWTLASKKGLL